MSLTWVESLAAAGLAAWLYLLFCRHRFWRLEEWLDAAPPAPAIWPGVVAVIPARDEAETIAAATRSFLAQGYSGRLSVIVVDDRSSDGTGAIVRALMPAAEAAGVGLEVVEGVASPTGWAGKPWAMAQGTKAAAAAAPKAAFLLYSDADIVHAPGTVTALVAKAEFERRDLVSLMVRLNCTSFWERRLIPAFVFFFRMLYPFAAVNDPSGNIAAAAGGCMLVRRATLGRAGGIEAIRAELIDDCALARKIKDAGGGLWLGLARGSDSLRPYRGLAELWRMVARSAFVQLRHSGLLLLGTVLAMGLVFLGPPFLALGLPLHGSLAAAAMAGLAWCASALAYAPMLRYYRLPATQSLLLPVAAALYVAMTIDSARRHWLGRGPEWKGRHYSRAPAESQSR